MIRQVTAKAQLTQFLALETLTADHHRCRARLARQPANEPPRCAPHQPIIQADVPWPGQFRNQRDHRNARVLQTVDGLTHQRMIDRHHPYAIDLLTQRQEALRHRCRVKVVQITDDHTDARPREQGAGVRQRLCEPLVERHATFLQQEPQPHCWFVIENPLFDDPFGVEAQTCRCRCNAMRRVGTHVCTQIQYSVDGRKADTRFARDIGHGGTQFSTRYV